MVGLYLNKEQITTLLNETQKRLYNLELMRARLGFQADPSITTEIEELKETIDNLLEEFQRSDKEISTELIDIVMESHLQSRVTETKLISGLFINREEEVEKLTSAQESPFVLVDAPGGYGKSFLLLRVLHDLKQKDWKVFFLDLKEKHWAAESKRGFLQAINTVFYLDQKEFDLRTNIEDALDWIIGQLAGKTPPVLFILDHTELVEKTELVNWIRYDFFYKLYYHIHDSVESPQWRFIVAGRYIGQKWREPVLDYIKSRVHHPQFDNPIRLTPFSYKTIRRAVVKLDQRRHDGKNHLISKAIDRNTRVLQLISGGHPECLTKLLADIGDANNTAEYYYRNRLSLFLSNVNQTCETILDDIDCELRPLFPYLSLVRCYESSLIQIVISWIEEFDPKSFLSAGNSISASTVFKKLSNQNLIIYQKDKRFHRDKITRRVTAMQVRLTSNRKNLRQLNSRLLKKYEQWLENPSQPDPVHYRATLVEHLYHFCMELDYNPRKLIPKTIETRLKKLVTRDIELFLQHFQDKLDPIIWPEELKIIINDLQNDEEIAVEVANLIDQEGPYETLLQQVKEAFLQTNND